MNTCTPTDPRAGSLAWTNWKVPGSAGRFYYAESDGWKFTCDLSRKGGWWAVRGWRQDEDGSSFIAFIDFARTLKEVKQSALELVLNGFTDGCDECECIHIHKSDCSKGR